MIAEDCELYQRVAGALVALGAVTLPDALDGDAVQLTDTAGRLFTLFDRVPIGTEWEVFEGPFTTRPGVRMPDMRRVSVCPFECRWPDFVAQVAEVAARTKEGWTWLLDGDGVVWNATAVDSSLVRL